MHFKLSKLKKNSLSKITVILGLFFASNASAAFIAPELKINELSTVTVKIDDQMQDGCWTNLGEVKRYLEDKLRNRGVNVGELEFTDPDLKNYNLVISALGGRLPNDACVGYLSISLWAGTFINGTFHIASIFEDGVLLTSSSNMNNKILDFVGNSVRELD